jgi:hypothetical protein
MFSLGELGDLGGKTSFFQRPMRPSGSKREGQSS